MSINIVDKAGAALGIVWDKLQETSKLNPVIALTNQQLLYHLLYVTLSNEELLYIGGVAIDGKQKAYAYCFKHEADKLEHIIISDVLKDILGAINPASLINSLAKVLP